MDDKNMERGQLIDELDRLRRRAVELEAAESEHKRVQEELRHSEERFRALIESSFDFTIILDAQGNITYLSPNIVNLWGRSASELLGRDMYKYIHPDDIPAIGENFVLLLKNPREPRQIYLRAQHVDGTWRTLEVRAHNQIANPAVGGIVVNFRDVTERKKAEEALQESEERHRLIVETQKEMICRFLPDTTLTFVNDAYCRTFQMSREKLIGRRFLDLIPAKAHKTLLDSLRELSPDAPSLTHEHQVLLGGGNIGWNEWTNYAFFDEDGEVKEFLAIGRDVTERRRAEEELQRKEHYFRSLIENSNDGIMVLNRDGTIRYESQSNLRLLGYTAEERIGKSVSDPIHPDDIPVVVRAFEKTVGGTMERAEVRARHKDGSWRFIEATATNMLDDPAVGGIVVNMRDITERRQVEDKYSMLVENATDGVTIIQDKVIKFANKRMAEMSGYSMEELTGMSTFDLVPPDFISVLQERFRLRAEGREVPDIFETAMLCKDGTVKEMESSTKLIQYEGRPAALGIVRDITERRLIEKALRESEEKYRTLILNIRDAIFIIKDGKIRYANEGFARITDYSIYELIGKGIDELVAPEYLPMVADRYARRMKGENVPTEYEFRLVKKDGVTRVDVVMDVGVVSYEGGPAAMGIGKDITERKRMEEALRESEEKLRILFQTVGVGITVTDISGKIIDVNEELLRLTGFDRKEEVIGRNGFDFISEKDRDRAAQALANNLASGRGVPIELTLLRKDGSEYLADTDTTVMQDANGNPIGLIVAHRDITERKRAEEMLRESEEKYRLLAENASDVIMLMDMNARPVYFSTSVTRLLGYSVEEALAGSMNDRMTPASAEKAVKHFMIGLDMERREPGGSLGQTLELEMIHKSGSIVIVEMMISFIRDESGKPTGMMAILRDITERKKAQEEILQLSNAFKAAIDPILICDMQGKVVNANDAARKLFERDEFGVSALEAVVPEDKDRVAAALQDLMVNGRPSVAQFNIVTRGGRRVLVEASGNIIFDAGGKPVGIVVVERDLTERRQAEGRQKLAAEVLGILNEALALPDAINRILAAIKRETGFYAVGIRLKDGDDYPYFVQNGFSEDFLLTENTLLVRDKKGGICRDKDGKVSLECTCGLVISGKTDPSNPLFTPGGSAWTNDSLPILDLPAEQDPRLHPRNRCIHAGFQSVALMPIRAGNEIVGLLQLNDRRKGCFTAEMIRFFEGIAASIGVALMRKQAETALQESERKMRSLFEVSPDVIMNIDREGKILFINRATARAIEEAIGTQVYDYIPSEYQSLYAQTIENVFITGKPDRIETKGLGPGKRISWYEARFVAMGEDEKSRTVMVVATDITERRQAEEARKESEEKFRTAFDNANTGMCLVGLSGNLIKVNDKMSEIFGYSVEELERLTVNSITHPADQDVSPRFMEKALGGQVKGSTFEKRFLTKDGRMVWGLVSSALVHGADGEPLYFISQVQDITEQKKAQQALRDSEERLRVTLEVTQIGVWEWNVKDDTWYASPTYYTMLGYEPVIGPADRKVWLKRGHPDDVKMVAEKIKNVLSGLSDSYRYEARIKHADGSYRWNSVVGHVVESDANGKPIRLAGVRIDITERKSAEESLRVSEEKHRMIADMSQDIICTMGFDGVTTYASPAVEKILGYTPDELIGRNVFDFVAERSKKELVDRFMNVLDLSVQVPTVEVEEIRKDGACVFIEYSNSIIKDGDKPVGVLAIGRDITEQKRAQQAVRESEIKYRDLFEHTLLGMEVVDGTTGKIVLANHSMAMMFGFKSPDDMVGIDAIKGHILPEDMDWVQQQFAQALADPTKHDMVTLRAKTVDGRIIWVTGSATSYIYEGKLAMLISLIDVTAAKEMQEKLRESEDRITSIVSTSQEWIWAIDSTGCHSFSNPAIEKILGYRPDEIVGHDVVSMIHAEDVAIVRQLLSRCIKLKTGWASLVLRWKHKDGGYRYLESNAVPIFDSRGAVSGFQGTDRDITERKKAEEQLLRISKAVEGSSDAIGMSDPQGHHFYHNKAFTELFEYTPEELHAAGDGPAVFANRHVARKVFDTIMGGGSWSGEVDMVSRSGRKITVLERADAIKDESGKVIGLVGVHTDITERKKAEEKLRETRDYMENLIEHANVPMVVWAPDFRITRFNRAFERLTGMKAKAVIGKDLEILFPKQSRDRSMSFIRTAMKGARWEVVEIPIANVDGDIRTVLWNISPIWAEDGKTPIAIIAQGQDITERKKAEEALRESEELSRSMLDNAAMGIYLLQNKKFIYVNPTFEKIIGYSSEELLGQEPINYVHPDDRDQVRDKAVENIKGISVMPYEFRALRKDGKQIWVMERVTPVRYKGKRAVLASFMETTEHKKAEVELERAYEELKTAHERMVQSEKLRAMGEMASGIAHDFNNMLAVILGRTQLVIDDVKDDKVRKGIQIIEQAALDAAKTVKRLQDFARIRVEHPFEPLDVNEVIGGVLKMVESRRVELEQTKGIAIKVEQGLGKVGTVSGDAAELREALLNILFNALDAMPTGGRLTVKSEQDEEWVQITIKDTGVGIPDKVKTKVFQPFFTTKASKGSGLGLSVTYGIISRHGGMIKFDSEVGKGTTFYIRLPLAVEEAKKQSKKSKAAAVKPASILAVDDEPEVLKALGLTLEYFGHWVKDFTSGAEAVKAFKDGKYDLVITDLGMPEMSGWDVARAVKKMKPDIPVLLITGWVIDLDEDKKKLVDGVIAKPFSRESIASAISGVYPAKKKGTAKKSQAVNKKSAVKKGSGKKKSK